MRLLQSVAFLAGLVAVGIPAIADTPVDVDLGHTSATFSLKHLTISTVTGVIPVTSVKVSEGADHVPTAVEAVLDLTKINTQNDKRDTDLKSEHWFDVAKYPNLTFKSTKITPTGGGNFTMNGDMTAHGITKPVTLTCTLNGTIKDGRGRTHAGYDATTTVDRTQWVLGPGYAPLIAGNTITIKLEVETISGG